MLLTASSPELSRSNDSVKSVKSVKTDCKMGKFLSAARVGEKTQGKKKRN